MVLIESRLPLGGSLKSVTLASRLNENHNYKDFSISIQNMNQQIFWIMIMVLIESRLTLGVALKSVTLASHLNNIFQKSECKFLCKETRVGEPGNPRGKKEAYLSIGGMNADQVIKVFLGGSSLESQCKALDHLPCVWSHNVHTNNTILLAQKHR